MGMWPWSWTVAQEKSAATTTSSMEMYLNKSHCRELMSNKHPSLKAAPKRKWISCTRPELRGKTEQGRCKRKQELKSFLQQSRYMDSFPRQSRKSAQWLGATLRMGFCSSSPAMMWLPESSYAFKLFSLSQHQLYAFSSVSYFFIVQTQ